MSRNSFVSCLPLLCWAGQLYGAAQAVPLARGCRRRHGDMITERELDKAAAPQLAKEGLSPAKPGDAERSIG